MKTCLKCKLKKSTKEYDLNKNRKDGYQAYCRVCRIMDYNKCEIKEATNKIMKIDERKLLLNQNKKRCSTCNIIKNINYFYSKPQRISQLMPFCKKCSYQKKKKHNSKNHFKYICWKIKAKCKKKNITYNLTDKYLEDMYKNQGCKCALTNISFQSFENTSISPYTLSIDRIIPSAGYIVGNVRLVLYAINCALNEWGEDVFKTLCKAYLENKK